MLQVIVSLLLVAVVGGQGVSYSTNACRRFAGMAAIIGGVVAVDGADFILSMAPFNSSR